MRLWRLSDARLADSFDGGYGLLHDGRWSRVGRPVTYAATSPALCVLEKLVHVEDPQLLPPLTLVAYDIPDSTPVTRYPDSDLPAGWRHDESMTQSRGNEWLETANSALLIVPSVIVPVADSPDRNVLINHRHPTASAIVIARTEPFDLDVRLIS